MSDSDGTNEPLAKLRPHGTIGYLVTGYFRSHPDGGPSPPGLPWLILREIARSILA